MIQESGVRRKHYLVAASMGEPASSIPGVCRSEVNELLQEKSEKDFTLSWILFVKK